MTAMSKWATVLEQYVVGGAAPGRKITATTGHRI